jgi:hypothetical protein
MNLITACLIGVAIATAPLLSAIAAPDRMDRSTGAAARPLLVAAAVCPAGRHWEQAGYARGGKWRPGHCAKDWIAR